MKEEGCGMQASLWLLGCADRIKGKDVFGGHAHQLSLASPGSRTRSLQELVPLSQRWARHAGCAMFSLYCLL